MKLQHETDFENPRERVAWALRGMEYNGFPFLAPEEVFADWSEHLSKTGFIHLSQLAKFADEDGILDLKKLPYTQDIHYQPPVHGQDHILNASGQWVPVEQEIVESRVSLFDQLTPQEKAELLERLKDD